MSIRLKKNAIDLGIVAKDGPGMLSFYKDLLGLHHEADIPFPSGGVMHRLWCGDSLIKIVIPEPSPEKFPEKQGITGALGYRYWTMIVDNLEEIMTDCQEYGSEIITPITTIRPGVTIGIVTDPEGNLVEFVEQE